MRKNVGYVKMRFIIDVFAELGFINAKTYDGIVFNIKMIPSNEKKPLQSSELFRRLNGTD